MLKYTFLISIALLLTLKGFAATVSSNAVTGNWTSGTSWSGGVLPSTNDTVVIVSGANITLNTNAIIYKIKINTGGTLNIGSYTLTLQGNAINYGSMFITGTLNLNTGTINLTGNWECYGGTFNCNTGTVNFNGNAGQGILGGTSVTFFNLTSSNTNNTIGNGLSLHEAHTIVKGNMVANGTFNRNSNANYNNKITFAGNTQLSGTVSFYLHNVVIDTLCTLNAGSKTIYLYGNWTGKGSFICGTSTIWFSYDPAHATHPNQDFYQANPDLNPYNNLYINKTTGSVTQISGYGNLWGNLYVNNNFTVQKGSYDCGGVHRLYVKGNVLVNGTNGGIFVPNLGRLLMNGTSAQTLDMGGSELYKFTISNNAGVTLASDMKITNELNLSGGIINTTSAYGVWVSNSDTVSIVSYSSSGFIAGRLRRSVVSGIKDYVFPMGPLNMGSSLYRPITYKQTSSGGASVIAMYEDNISNTGTNKANWYFKIGSDAGNPNAQVKVNYNFSNDFPSGTTECALTVMRGDIIPTPDWNTMLTTVTAAGTSHITSQLPASLSPYYFIIGEVAPVMSNTTICSGNTASLSVSSPTGTTSYNWYDAATGGTALATGNASYTTPVLNTTTIYYVSHQHELTGCFSHRQPVTVTVKQTPTSTFSSPAPSCYNSNSSVSYTGNAGSSASYIWNFGGGTVISGSGQGPYSISWPSSQSYTASLQVTENGCTSTLTTNTIAVPAEITLTPAHTDASCGNANGAASVTASGGSGAYSYSWSNGGTNSSISNVAAGNYGITVTDGNGCQKSTTVSVSNIGGPSASVVLNSNVLCNGGNNGSATVNASGTGTISYLWSTGATTATASNLTAGTHSVTVTDGNTCTASQSITISQPSALSINFNATNATCYGAANGTANASVTGGTSGYNYQWSSGGTSANITGLIAGTYSLTVTDAHSCTSINSVVITEPAQIQGTTVITPVSCANGNNGSINLSPSGGTISNGYTYIWSNFSQSEDIQNLIAGTYIVTISDDNGCTGQASATVTEPSSIGAQSAIADASCYGGNNGGITLTVNGGTPGYTYLWSNGNTNQNPSPLQAGIYFVTITDANLCTLVFTDTVSEPDSLILGFATNSVLCFGAATGAINLNIQGGTLPYTYNWSTSATSQNISGLAAGNYSVTVTDGNNCTNTGSATILQIGDIDITTTVTNANCYGSTDGQITASATGGTPPLSYLWSNTATNANITGGSGTYTVTVTDANGCNNIMNATINQPSELILSLTKTDVNCFGENNGTASVSATGGTSGYSFAWSSAPVQTTAQATNLPAGVITVTVTDANNCTKTSSETITQPSAITAIIYADSTNCFASSDGKTHCIVTGGTAPYTYLWNSTPAQTDTIAENLVAGIYLITITDSYGCSYTDTAIVKAPEEITASYTTTKTSCLGSTDGTATIVSAGGHAPHTYIWSTNPVQTSNTAINLAKGSYSVAITDNKNCTVTTEIIIDSEPEDCLEIPSAFTPNGDGKNDTWIIKHIDLYPQVSVEIFNRWGAAIFKSTGYTSPWDGKYNEKDVSTGSFIYIINLNNGTEALNGTVTIVR